MNILMLKPVNFAVYFNKIPENGDLWIPWKVYNVYEWFQGWRLKI